VDGAHFGVFGRESVGDLTGAVLAAVVDDDDFVILTDTPKSFERRQRGVFDVGFLVVAGKEHAERERWLRDPVNQSSTPQCTCQTCDLSMESA